MAMTWDEMNRVADSERDDAEEALADQIRLTLITAVHEGVPAASLGFMFPKYAFPFDAMIVATPGVTWLHSILQTIEEGLRRGKKQQYEDHQARREKAKMMRLDRERVSQMLALRPIPEGAVILRRGHVMMPGTVVRMLKTKMEVQTSEGLISLSIKNGHAANDRFSLVRI